MDLKRIMLTEMNYTQKVACCRILYIWHSGKDKMTENISFCPMLAVREEMDHKRGTGEILRVMELFYILTVVVFTCLYVLVKMCRLYTQKKVNFIACNYTSINLTKAKKEGEAKV